MPGLTPEMAKGALHMALMTIKKEHGTTKSVIAAIPAGWRRIQARACGANGARNCVAHRSVRAPLLLVRREGIFRHHAKSEAGFTQDRRRHREVLRRTAPEGSHGSRRTERRAPGQGNGFSRHVPDAHGGVLRPRPAPLGSSSRPAFCLSAASGRTSAGHLRRKLRLQKINRNTKASQNEEGPRIVSRPFSSYLVLFDL